MSWMLLNDGVFTLRTRWPLASCAIFASVPLQPLVRERRTLCTVERAGLCTVAIVVLGRVSPVFVRADHLGAAAAAGFLISSRTSLIVSCALGVGNGYVTVSQACDQLMF